MIKDRLKELKGIASNGDTSEVDGAEDYVCVDLPTEKGPSFIEPLIKRYVDILKEFELMRENINKLKSMLEAKNSHLFNEDEFTKVRQTNLQISNRLIDRFKKLESKLPKANDFRTQARMQRALYYGYFHEYAVLWTQHEEVLQKYEHNLKRNLQMQSKILNCNLTDEEIETLIENKQTSLLMDNILADTEETKKQLKEIKDRLDDLLKLEKSIGEVHGLFLRLQNLVVEQGEVMQSIEKHFDDARDHIAEGNAQIKIAVALRKRNIVTKTKLIIIGGILLLLILLYIINSFHCFMFCKKKK
ncbi:syntaxin-4 [Musca domestica]|uniref:Syntaxin-4-like n=1 Tax=Musca domestica TaxID=7370 RepID=A0A1I8NF19_MUSDO|nr:syntaxin-4 [Musca domestica]